MKRHGRGLVVLAMMVAVGCAGANGGERPKTSDEPRGHVLVQFTETSLDPAVAHVLRGGDVEWANFANHLVGVVVFPESIEDGFTCDELEPRFGKVAGGYQSKFITDDGERLDLPCPLKAGTYTYELRLFDLEFGGPDDPERTLKGTIAVE